MDENIKEKSTPIRIGVELLEEIRQKTDDSRVATPTSRDSATPIYRGGKKEKLTIISRLPRSKRHLLIEAKGIY